jgi:hypothetical protein
MRPFLRLLVLIIEYSAYKHELTGLDVHSNSFLIRHLGGRARILNPQVS